MDGRLSLDASGVYIQIKTRYSDMQELPQIYAAEDCIERAEYSGSAWRGAMLQPSNGAHCCTARRPPRTGTS
jgi:hypothetical protein